MGGLNPGVSVSATYRPVSNVSMSLGPSWSPSRTPTMYVGAFPDTHREGVLWNAVRDVRRSNSARSASTRGSTSRSRRRCRSSCTCNRSSRPAHFYDFEEYVAPRTDVTATYGRDRGTIAATRDATGSDRVRTRSIRTAPAPRRRSRFGNPDFSEQSLRGNAVFRWEYRPGSVLYVAWTQSRLADSAFGDLRFRPRSVGALRGAAGQHLSGEGDVVAA